MKEKYIELIEKALSAYSDEHILRYFNDVKEKGLTEHGFPRLTANIGILIAYGRRWDLLPIFLEMMEFCCKTIPHVKAANDFPTFRVGNLNGNQGGGAVYFLHVHPVLKLAVGVEPLVAEADEHVTASVKGKNGILIEGNVDKGKGIFLLCSEFFGKEGILIVGIDVFYVIRVQALVNKAVKKLKINLSVFLTYGELTVSDLFVYSAVDIASLKGQYTEMSVASFLHFSSSLSLLY